MWTFHTISPMVNMLNEDDATQNHQASRLHCVYPTVGTALTIWYKIHQVPYSTRNITSTVLCKCDPHEWFHSLSALMEKIMDPSSNDNLLLGCNRFLQESKFVAKPSVQLQWFMNLVGPLHGLPCHNSWRIIHERNFTRYALGSHDNILYNYWFAVQTHYCKKVKLCW